MSTDTQPIQDQLLQLEARILDITAQSQNERRRFRVLGGLAIMTVAAAMLLSHQSNTAIAQTNGTDITSRVKALEQKTQFMITDTREQLTTFSGCNIEINNGSGSTTSVATNAEGDGLGNIIVGYNASREGFKTRTGNHNLIVGDFNNYSSYGGIVAGSFNTIGAAYAMAIGGEQNSAYGFASCVTGGNENGTSGMYSSVSGGSLNGAYGPFTSVTGGFDNAVHGAYSSATGGGANTVWGASASISGGFKNVANGDYSTVTGGNANTAGGGVSTVTSGVNNIADGPYSAITGGNNNITFGEYSAISGGYGGVTNVGATSSSIGGGFQALQNTQNGWMGGSLHSP